MTLSVLQLKAQNDRETKALDNVFEEKKQCVCSFHCFQVFVEIVKLISVQTRTDDQWSGGRPLRTTRPHSQPRHRNGLS